MDLRTQNTSMIDLSEKNKWKKEKRQLYSRDGEPLPIDGGPYGIAYDEDGLPVPDWDIEEDDDAHGLTGSDGRRRCARIIGAVNMKDYLHLVKRTMPDWGKRFGLVKKAGIGYFGTYTIDDAKLCITTEDFGYKIPVEEEHLAPYPPYLRLCYGELHGDQDSIRIFTGLSEIHLLKDIDLKEVHYMIHGLGYVCYNHPIWEEDRWWGEGIDVYPQKVGSGMPGNKGPIFYSWYYRLPPWMPGLCLEGEDGDYISGPLALKRKAKEERERIFREKINEEQLIKLKARRYMERVQRIKEEAEAALAGAIDMEKE